MVAGVVCSGFTTVQGRDGIRASTKLTRRIFKGVRDIEHPWLYIYIHNPTWKNVSVSKIKFDVYVNGEFYGPGSGDLTPDWHSERWDTNVLPFERSVICWCGWKVVEDEPEGIYVMKITIYATVDGEGIELKTKAVFRVIL